MSANIFVLSVEYDGKLLSVFIESTWEATCVTLFCFITFCSVLNAPFTRKAKWTLARKKLLSESIESLSIQLSLSEGNRFRSGQEHDWKPFRDENGGILRRKINMRWRWKEAIFSLKRSAKSKALSTKNSTNPKHTTQMITQNKQMFHFYHLLWVIN